MSHRLAVAIFAAALVLIAAIPIASAGPAPGLSPSRITFDEPLGQGEKIDLPTMTVRNGGDAPGRFTMDLPHSSDQKELQADDSWFRFDPQRFELQPGDSQLVLVSMRIPRDAVVGEYLSLLRTSAAPLELGTGTIAIAAVAARMSFTVKNVNFHFYDPVVDFFQERAPFSYVGISMLLGLLAVYIFQRSYGLDINIGLRRKG